MKRLLLVDILELKIPNMHLQVMIRRRSVLSGLERLANANARLSLAYF